MAKNSIEPTLGQGPVVNLYRHTDVVWWNSALLNVVIGSPNTETSE